MWKQDYVYPGMPSGPSDFGDEIEYGLKRLRDRNPDNEKERVEAMKQSGNADKLAWEAQRQYAYDVEPGARYQWMKHFGLDVPKELENQNENARVQGRFEDEQEQARQLAYLRDATSKYIARLREQGQDRRLGRRIAAEKAAWGGGEDGTPANPAEMALYGSLMAQIKDPQELEAFRSGAGYGGDAPGMGAFNPTPQGLAYLRGYFGNRSKRGLSPSRALRGGGGGGNLESDIEG